MSVHHFITLFPLPTQSHPKYCHISGLNEALFPSLHGPLERLPLLYLGPKKFLQEAFTQDLNCEVFIEWAAEVAPVSSACIKLSVWDFRITQTRQLGTLTDVYQNHRLGT
jgi:hypothetical protein